MVTRKEDPARNDLGLLLTEGEAALLDGIEGRLSPELSERLLRSSSFSHQAELRWDADLVKRRLQEAVRGCERLAGRIGPSRKSGFWPDMTVEFADQVAMMGTKELDAFYRAKNRAQRGGLGDREISRIEEAIQWPLRYLSADAFENERQALKVWVWCEAKDESFSRFFVIACRHRSTALRRRDRAFDLILDGLLADGVLP